MKYSNAVYFALLVLAVNVPSTEIRPWHISPAFADDDDDDGGGGISGGGNGGQTVIKKARKFKSFKPAPTARRARPVTLRALPERVRFELVASGLDAAGKQQLLQRGYQILSEQRLQSTANRAIARLGVPRSRSIADARAEVAALSNSVSVDFNHYYRPQQNATCEGPACETLEIVAWPDMRQASCGRNLVIGIVETKVNTGHEALRGQSIETIPMARQGLAESGQQHGTAIAALLVGAAGSRSPGLLPDATLIAVDPYHRGAGGDDRTDIYDLVRAIDYLVWRKPNAINLSLSGPSNELLEDAVSSAGSAGIPIIAAAGNSGPRAKPLYPSAYDDVIAVTAVDSGMEVYRRAGRGEHIDFAAPGVGIWTAASGKGIRQSTGTSFAAPFVTAAAALASASNPSVGSDGVVARLAQSALDLGKTGKDATFGHGLVRATGACES